MNICIFGDSIVWGETDTSYGGWAQRIKLFALRRNKDNVYVLGVPGDTSHDLLVRIQGEAIARNAEKIIVAIGINDCQFVKSSEENRVSEEDFLNNLEKIFQIAESITSDVSFISLTRVDEGKTTPISWNNDKYYFNKTIDRYDHILHSFCNERGISLIDINDCVREGDLGDGLHPGERAHKRIFQKVVDTIL